MRSHSRLPAFMLVGFATLCAFLSWVTDGSGWSTVWYSVGGYAACAGAVVGIVRYRPRPRWPWVCLALGLLGTATGDLLWDLTELITRAPGYTSLFANLAYLCSYPLFAAGVIGLLGPRTRHGDVLVLLEAGSLAVAAWLVLWVQAVHPALADGGLGIWDWLPTVLYPPLDIVVIVAVWQLGRGDLRRSGPWLLLAGAFGLMLAADTLYAVLGMPSAGVTSWSLNVLWLTSYGAIGAAALHPGMRYLRGDPEPTLERSQWMRTAVVATAGLTPLVLLLAIPDRVAPVSELVAITGFVIVLVGAARFQIVALRNRDAAALLAYRASHDTLTGLANRTALIERLTLACRRAQRRHTSCAVLFLDLDGFKFVNDSLGHARGDELLQTVGERLRSATRSDECVARLGGDEFVVVLEDLSGAAAAMEAANRIAAQLGNPVRLGDSDLVVRASVGVVADAQRYVDASERALRDADLAMYEAKSRGGGVSLFDPEMHARAIEMLDRRTALRIAAANDELRLEYQPIFDARTGEAILVEALLRWRRDGRDVPTTDFIALAESSGEIVPIGEWVLRHAVAELAAMTDSPSLGVSVNISARQLREPRFAARVLAIVHEAEVAPERVVLELTESALLEPDVAVDGNISRLGAAGFALAIDDFGTGYSSLAYLKRLDVDWLKIDRMFVQDLGVDADDEALVRTIIRMASELGVRVIAEGVESETQLQLLQRLGCDAVQGFLLAPPIAEMVEAGRVWNAAAARAS